MYRQLCILVNLAELIISYDFADFNLQSEVGDFVSFQEKFNENVVYFL